MDDDLKQLSLFFNQAEYKNNLFLDKVDDIEIWKYIRNDVFRIIMSKKHEVFHESKSKNEYRNKSKIVANHNNLLRDFLVTFRERNFYLQRKDILFLIFDRRLLVDNRYMCPYTDVILDQLDMSYCILQLLTDEKKVLKSTTKNLRYLNQDKIKEKYNDQENKLNRVEANTYIQKIETSMQIEFDADEKKAIGKDIEDVVKYRAIYKKYFAYVLSKLNPKVVCVLPSTRHIVMHLIETAKERGIPVVEIQHGAVNDIMVQHNYYNKQNISTYADYLFEYGKNIVKNTRYPIEEDKVIPIGYPFLEYIGSRTKEKIKKNTKIKTITILSSRQDKLQELAIRLSQDLDPMKYRIFFKLHPVEYDIWKEVFPLLRISKVKVISDNKYSLYHCLAKSDVVLGINSTALFEATLFDVRIMIYKDSDYQISSFLYENGIADLVQSYEELREKVTENCHIKGNSFDNVFTRNSIDNFKRETSKIIKKHHNN